MNREKLDKWCEQGILGLVLAILVYGPLATGAVHTRDFLVIQALTMGVMLLWAVRLWVKPGQQLLWPPMCWSVIAFAIYAIGRYYTADIEYVARKEMLATLIYAFLFLAILNNLHRQEHSQIITLTLIFLAMAISFYAIYQFLTDSDHVWTYIKPYPHRGSGTYISPNNLAGFLEMLLPLGLAWLLVSRAKPLTKVFLGYASLVILAGVAVTVSRGSWISVGLVLTLFFGILLLRRTYRLPAALLLVVIAGAGLYFLPRTHFFQERLKQLTTADNLDDNVRFDLWKPAVELWRTDIWWGIGPGLYNYRFREFRPESVQRDPDRVHNDYLNTLTDWGIVGTALVASAFVLLCAGALKTWRSVRGSPNDFNARKSNKLALVLGTSLGLLAILLHSVVDFNMHIPANAILAITLMAILSGCVRFATGRYWFGVRRWSKLTLTLLLIGGLGYLGWQEIRSATELAWLERARQAPNLSSAQIVALQKAFAVEPMNFETAYAIGEVYRMQSLSSAGENEAAAKALPWYQRSMSLNNYHGYSYMGYGICLDLLAKTNEAATFFDRAVKLDPNGYYTTAYMGWHYVQTGDFAAARVWFQRSLRLQEKDNRIAKSYLAIVTRRLLEAASEGLPGFVSTNP